MTNLRIVIKSTHVVSKCQKRKEIQMKILGESFIHVDNGGYGFIVQAGEKPNEICAPHIVVTDGYYGYSETRLSLNEQVTPQNLRAIGTMFMEAAVALENIMGVRDREHS